MFDFNAILAATCIETARNIATAQMNAACAVIDGLNMDGGGLVSDAIVSELGAEWLTDYRRLCGILGTLG
tara:strand:+ start:919 stop:1128 length:210 start_codon:yes stop_codon:yes gene_type:complete